MVETLISLAAGWYIGIGVGEWLERKRLGRIPFPTGVCGENFRVIFTTPLTAEDDHGKVEEADSASDLK